MTEMFLLDVLNKFNGKPANNEASEVSVSADLALTLVYSAQIMLGGAV